MRHQQGINPNDRSQVHIGTINYGATEKRDRAESILPEAVAGEVEIRQEYALHNRVHIELDMEIDPSRVERFGEIDVKVGSAKPERCPPETSIAEIFDGKSIRGRLLVLGAPGSGKTTLLLQIAGLLVERALADGAAPVPVLLNLSAWKSEFKDIRSWMVAGLKLKYGVKREKAEEWIEERRIVPLLDGLDELMSERQETCVRALNDFLAQDWAGSPLVVCSRREEYEVYESNLGLNGSVMLLPLSDGQIEWYLRGTELSLLFHSAPAPCRQSIPITASSSASIPHFLHWHREFAIQVASPY
ncbi:MAG: NACHT domain-containing protein [Geitlerinemataceae cyanobacterium]